jgi:hypothetical protein
MKRITWAIGLAVVLVAGATFPAEAGGGRGGGFHGGGGRSQGGGFRGGHAFHGSRLHGGGFRGGHAFHGSRFHGGTRVFIGGGIGWWGSPGWWGWPGRWGTPYPYYPAQPLVIQQAPTEYIQQAPTPPSAPQYWYYCQNAGAYYPYVKECPGGWMQVVPQPSPPGQ